MNKVPEIPVTEIATAIVITAATATVTAIAIATASVMRIAAPIATADYFGGCL